MAEYIVDGGKTSTGITLNNGDAMCVSNGGVASNTVVNNKGTLDVESGGVVSNTTVNYEGTLHVQSGGVASNTTVNSLCYMRVFEGGVMIDTTVNENGRIDIFNTEERDAVVVSNVTVNSGGSIEFMNDNLRGKLTGKMTFEPGANSVSAIYARGTIDFDLRQTTAGADPLLNDFSFVTDNNLSFTLTIDGSQESGTYKLAGNAAAFGGRTITVVNASDKTLGTISLDDNLFYKNGKSYTLAVTDSTLAVAVGTAPDNIFCDDLENATKNIYAGSSAVNVNVNFMGRLHISNGGVASNTTVNEHGYLYVSEGGVASDTTLNSQSDLYVSSGGKAIDTVASGSAAYLHIRKGGVASNTVLVGSDCALFVSDGGVAIDTTVGSSCQLQISSGGVASNVTVSAGGLIYLNDIDGGGGKLTGKMTFEDGAQQVYAKKNGAVIDFDLRQTKADADPLLNDFLYAMDSSLSFTLTVDGTQADGVYKLAGNAAKFGDRTITVVNASDETLGTLTLGGGTQTFGGVKYTLFLDSTTLAVAVGSLVFSGVVESGTKDIINPWSAVDVKVNDKGILNVFDGGKASNTEVNAGGEMFVSSGGIANIILLNPAGYLEVFSDGIANNISTIVSDYVESGGIFIQSGGKANGVTLNYGGYLGVFTDGAATDVVENGGYVYVEGEEEGKPAADVTFIPNSFSGLALDGALATVHSGTTATDIHVNSAGQMVIFSSGLLTSATVNASGSLLVLSGGTVENTTVNAGGDIYVGAGARVQQITENGGYVDIDDGATATFVPNTFSGYVLQDKQSASVNSGTTATDTTIDSGGWLLVSYGVASKTNVNMGGIITLWGGSAVDSIINSDGKIHVYEGTADNTTVKSGGEMLVSANGTATGATINAGGKMIVSDGGKLTGKMMFEKGATVTCETDAVLDFDLMQTAPGEASLVNDLSFIPETFVFTLTVDGTQANGMYSLAGGAADFDQALRVIAPSGTELGTLTVDGGTKTIGGAKYTLIREDDELALLVGDPLPPEPLNDTLYLGKKEVNTDVTGSYGNRLKAAGQEIRLDQIGSVEETITFNDVPHTFNNHVEKKADDKIDVIDYAKIVLKHGAKLSFHAEATAAATFTVYSLKQDKKGKYTLKKLQTLKLTDKDKDGVFTADSKKPVSLSVSGPYYVSMQFTDKKAEEAYFNVSLNGENAGVVFYNLGYNGDDWSDMKTAGYGGAVGDLGKVTASGHLIMDEWIGFGDKVDYKRFTLENAAELSLTANAPDGPLKLSVCKLKETTSKKGVTTYSQVTVKTITVKAKQGTASLDDLLLEAGDYFIKVASPNVKKSTGYEVQVTDSKFYYDADNGTNGWLYNRKMDKEHYNASLYANEVGPGSGRVYLETCGSGFNVMVDVDGEYRTYNDFVGFGDERDYAEIVVSAPGTCTFSLDVYGTSNSSSKFAVYSLTWNERKKTWTQKVLTTQTVKIAKKEDHVDGVATKTVNFKAATDAQTRYFVSMQSTGAKNGDEVYYNVTATLNSSDASALAMPETDSLGISDALSFGGYDADADALASAFSPAELDDKSVWRNTASLA